MPTTLRPRKAPAERRDPGAFNIVVSLVLLVAVCGLVCAKYLPPTPGYSLNRSIADLQLSP